MNPDPERRGADLEKRGRRGILYGLAAFGLWGLAPLFWPLVKRASAMELLAQRVLWSLTVAVILLIAIGGRARLRPLLNQRSLTLLTGAAVAVAVNWGIYIWAVNHNHVVEAALGYYINPLLSILAGVIWMGERLKLAQWIAVGFAAIAVIVLTIDYGQPPWIALSLALSFATYGILKKQLNAGAVESLTVESAILGLPALAYLIYLQVVGQLTFGHLGLSHSLLIAATGVITAIPLLCFAAAATRVPLSTMGLLQYVAPTAQFLLGVLYFHEVMSTGRWVGFALVWIALIILSIDGLRRANASRLNSRADILGRAQTNETLEKR